MFDFEQTDPNWSNFLYDEVDKSINLIDFGAARDYPKYFVDNYLRMVRCVYSDASRFVNHPLTQFVSSLGRHELA